jgi:hypothetical protein
MAALKYGAMCVLPAVAAPALAVATLALLVILAVALLRRDASRPGRDLKEGLGHRAAWWRRPGRDASWRRRRPGYDAAWWRRPGYDAAWWWRRPGYAAPLELSLPIYGYLHGM